MIEVEVLAQVWFKVYGGLTLFCRFVFIGVGGSPPSGHGVYVE